MSKACLRLPTQGSPLLDVPQKKKALFIVNNTYSVLAAFAISPVRCRTRTMSDEGGSIMGGVIGLEFQVKSCSVNSLTEDGDSGDDCSITGDIIPATRTHNYILYISGKPANNTSNIQRSLSGKGQNNKTGYSNK